MSRDDDDASPRGRSALPPRVLRALAQVREAARADQARRGGRWLALVPIVVGALTLALVMPRATAPESVPLPRVDLRAVVEASRLDERLAASAEAERLPADVLAVGSALRELSGAEARGGDDASVLDARRTLDAALRELARRPGFAADLRALRAVQTQRFVAALARWEEVGETSEDFVDLAASFVERVTVAGWSRGRRLLLSEAERRIMFKAFWNILAGLDAQPELALTLDEQRALYAFYLRNPRPAESVRLALEAELRAATTPEACARAQAEQRRHAELWRAEKIKKLGALDASYPTAYALGVAYFRAGRFDLSAEALTEFLGQRPDGPLTLRARNHLRAALVAGGGR